MTGFTKPRPASTLAYTTSANNILQGDYWVVTEPFEYRVGDRYSREVVTVPRGYLFNERSVRPNYYRFLYSGKSTVDLRVLASVVHAYLYETKTVIINNVPVPVDYHFADKVFIEALKVADVSFFQLWFIRFAICYYHLFKIKREVCEPDGKGAVENMMRHNLETKGEFHITPSQREQLVKRYPNLQGAK